MCSMPPASVPASLLIGTGCPRELRARMRSTPGCFGGSWRVPCGSRLYVFDHAWSRAANKTVKHGRRTILREAAEERTISSRLTPIATEPLGFGKRPGLLDANCCNAQSTAAIPRSPLQPPPTRHTNLVATTAVNVHLLSLPRQEMLTEAVFVNINPNERLRSLRSSTSSPCLRARACGSATDTGPCNHRSG